MSTHQPPITLTSFPLFALAAALLAAGCAAEPAEGEGIASYGAPDSGGESAESGDSAEVASDGAMDGGDTELPSPGGEKPDGGATASDAAMDGGTDPSDGEVPPPAPVLGDSVGAHGWVSCAIQGATSAKPCGPVVCWGTFYSSVLSIPAALGPTPVLLEGPECAVDLDVNSDHACAVDADGAVWCWGFNHHGQLGYGERNDTFYGVPQMISDLPSDIVEVAVGDNHSCALDGEGAVWCWGFSAFHQTGAAFEEDVLAPRRVEGLSGVQRLEAGGWHTCALRDDAHVWCWGFNPFGELGHAAAPEGGPAAPVEGLGAVIGISMDGHGSWALDESGAIWHWGLVDFNQPQVQPAIERTVAGAVELDVRYDFGCARLSGGAVACWGQGGHGQLGIGEAPSSPPEGEWPLVVGLDDATDLAIGLWHACAHKEDGSLACWGDNQNGQLGTSTLGTAPASAPRPVASGATALTTGYDGGCIVDGDGTVECWGRNDAGQLGDGTTSHRAWPAPVPGVTGATDVEAGCLFTCALTSAGVSCWGAGVDDAFGMAVTPIPGTAGAIDLAVGCYHACALLADGTAACWGDNTWGQLGDGTFESSVTPVAAAVPEALFALVAGEQHSCGLTSAGQVWCWGSDKYGELGKAVDLTGVRWEGFPSGKTYRAWAFAEPTSIPFETPVALLAAHGRNTCFAFGTGAIHCAGVAYGGQTIAVATVATPTDLAMHDGAGCVLGAGSELGCWGEGMALPLAGAIPGAIELALGNPSCARTAGGDVACWGSNTWGGLGDGTGFSSTPVAVSPPNR